MVKPVQNAVAVALGVLLVATLPVLGCAAAAPAPRAPIAAPLPLPATPTVAPTAAEGPPSPLPFHLPCADDDRVGCTAGCDDHHVEDCVTLGVFTLSHAPEAPDTERAVSLFRAACGAGSARGCLKLGDAYHAGVITGDAEEALAYRQACDAGANLGCVAAAAVLVAGRGVAADPAHAALLLTRVCDRGNARACFELGRLYRSGEGVKLDGARATMLFEKSCKLGLDEGCFAASQSGSVLAPRE